MLTREIARGAASKEKWHYDECTWRGAICPAVPTDVWAVGRTSVRPGLAGLTWERGRPRPLGRHRSLRPGAPARGGQGRAPRAGQGGL